MSAIGTVFGNQNKSYLEGLLRQSLNSFKSFGYQQITVDSTVQGLTIPDGAKYALLTLESDGTGYVARVLQNLNTVISSSVGMPIANGFIGDITDAENLRGFRITQTGSNTTILNVEYFK